MPKPIDYERHFPWYADADDTTNIDCQCGHPIGDGIAGWATHINNTLKSGKSMRNHRIETAVYVYLTLDCNTGQWVIDPVTVDGAQLDNTFIDGSECECLRGTSHHEVMEYAKSIPMPTGTELIGLLEQAAENYP